jgi:hypothetical protein
MDTYNSLNDQFGTFLNGLIATYIDPSLDYQTVGFIGLCILVPWIIASSAAKRSRD